jgi:hypothetical protein
VPEFPHVRQVPKGARELDRRLLLGIPGNTQEYSWLRPWRQEGIASLACGVAGERSRGG